MPAAPAPLQPAGRKKVLALVIVAVIVVAVLAAAVYFILSGAPPGATLNRVDVTAAKTAVDQREVVSVVAVATDTAGANRTAATTFAWTVTPAGRVQLNSTTGASVTATAIEAGTATLSARGTLSGVSRTGNESLVIAALHFDVVASNPTPFPDDPFDLSVTARRSDNSIATTYRGEVDFSSPDDPLATLPGRTRFAAADSGAKTLGNVRIQELGPVDIVARDILAPITGTVTVT
ncbi:MAG: hypothetical protein ACT4OI_02240, partial [Methanobacteriota archaeon]